MDLFLQRYIFSKERNMFIQLKKDLLSVDSSKNCIFAI